MHFSKYILVSIAATFFPSECVADGWDDSYKMDFSYDTSAANGPENWPDATRSGQWNQYSTHLNVDNNRCDRTNRPSPLDIRQTQGCIDFHELMPRKMSDGDCTQDDVTFEITPYSLKAYFPLNDDTCERPILHMSGRFDSYTIMWMEMHTRSEHLLDGKRYDAELQMVHYGNGNDRGRVLTVSVMIEADAEVDNLEFEWLLKQWERTSINESDRCDGRARNLRADNQSGKKKQSGEKKPFKNTDSAMNTDDEHRDLQFSQYSPSDCRTDKFGNGCEPEGPRQRMFPYNLWPSIWYYGYTGSMTSPPCSEIVQWRILDEPMQISRRQYKLLTALSTRSVDDSCQSDSAFSKHGENFRPIQERNQFFQSIYHCTVDHFSYYAFPPNQQ